MVRDNMVESKKMNDVKFISRHIFITIICEFVVFLLLFWICDNFLQLKLIESRFTILVLFFFWMDQLGIPDCNGYRALCWKILLGYLGCKTPDWPNILQKKRQLYKQFISE